MLLNASCLGMVLVLRHHPQQHAINSCLIGILPGRSLLENLGVAGFEKSSLSDRMGSIEAAQLPVSNRQVDGEE